MPSALPLELREAAIAYAAEHGVTASAKEYGLGKATISRWCSKAGVETVPTETMSAAREAAQRISDERREKVKARLWEIADKASIRELELLAQSPKLRDVVGARTRAIHDAELLHGRATGRTEQTDTIDAELQRLAEEVKARQ